MGGKSGQHKDHQVGSEDTVETPGLCNEATPLPVDHKWWKDEMSDEEFHCRLREKIREEFMLLLDGKKEPKEVFRDLDTLAQASVPEGRTQPQVFAWEAISDPQRAYLVSWGKVLLLGFRDHEHRVELLASLTKTAEDLHESWSLMVKELEEKEEMFLEFVNGPIQILDEIKLLTKKLRFDDALIPLGTRLKPSLSSGKIRKPRVPLVRLLLIGLGWMWQINQPGILKLLSEIGYQEWDKSSKTMQPLTRRTVEHIVQEIGVGGWSALLSADVYEQ